MTLLFYLHTYYVVGTGTYMLTVLKESLLSFLLCRSNSLFHLPTREGFVYVENGPGEDFAGGDQMDRQIRALYDMLGIVIRKKYYTEGN